MESVTPVTRAARIPDDNRVQRCLRLPELGPRLLFLSGGTALRGVARTLKRFTHNSIHVVTPFDSGGSSAVLRDAFGMLSVGDLRSRLMALADETSRGNPSIYALFSHRFEARADPVELVERLEAMVRGVHPLVSAVPTPMRRLVQTHLRQFAERMPGDFDLRGASVGNLLLVGGYLHNERDIDSVIFLFSRLVEVRGQVLPVADSRLHLRAELADGREILRQHRLTGKGVAPIEARVTDLGLVDETGRACRIAATAKVLGLIRSADLICFPVGSFYSSVVANLLPQGVGSAVAAVECPKVYVPNLSVDPEQVGMSLSDSVAEVLRYVRRDAGQETPAEAILQLVLIDPKAHYAMALDIEQTRALGVRVLETPLTQGGRLDRLDPTRVCEALVSLA